MITIWKTSTDILLYLSLKANSQEITKYKLRLLELYYYEEYVGVVHPGRVYIYDLMGKLRTTAESFQSIRYLIFVSINCKHAIRFKIKFRLG